MPLGSRICPHCGALNASDDQRCYRCEQRLPGPLATSAREAFFSVLGAETPIIRLIAVMCVVVFMLSVLGKGEFPIWFGQSARGSELIRWGALFGPLFWLEPWRHVSAIFVHANGLHILFNMMALASFGRVAEGGLGSGRFTLVFVVTGVVGYLASDVWYLLWYGFVPVTMGASGAVFGVLGTVAGEAWARRTPDWKAQVTRAFAFAVLMFLLFGLGAGIGVNNAAHFAGLFAGLALGYGFGKERHPLRRNKLFNRIAALLLIGSALSVVASSLSPAWKLFRQQEIRREAG